MAKKIVYVKNGIEFYNDRKGNEKYVTIGFTVKALSKLFYVSDGNEKLQSNAQVRFMIWNIPAVCTCPYRTPLCEKYCYAKKAENFRKECLPCRQRNLDFSKSEKFVESMIALIKIKLNNLKPNQTIFFRIHESGDFYNKAYTQKWLEIIRYFENDKRIVFMAYTKSVRFFVGENLPKNFSLRFSIWEDTKQEEIDIAKSLNLPIYTALKAEDLEKLDKNSYFYCDCVDCGTCRACYYNGHKMIICKIH